MLVNLHDVAHEVTDENGKPMTEKKATALFKKSLKRIRAPLSLRSLIPVHLIILWNMKTPIPVWA